MAVLRWSLVLMIIVNIQCQEQFPKPHQPGDRVQYPDDYCAQIRDFEEFDFIVVGAGPGGSAVARRLAEIPTNQVLLLEAGGDPPSTSDIPAEVNTLGAEVRWNFHSARDQYACLGFTDSVCKYVPGKVLGGSSVMNAMQYVRGNTEDFEEWKRMGNYGWGYQDVLPYFKKLENYLANPIVNPGTTPNYPLFDQFGSLHISPLSHRTDPVSSTYHSSGGPLSVSAYSTDPKTHLLRQALLKSFEANGIPYNNDINSDNQMGGTNLPATIDPLGYRSNVAKAYLQHIPNNLKVCKNALVYKVNIDPLTTPKVITSVKFVHSPNPQIPKGRTLHAVARKEYILSGGALNSPAILERSGIGIPEVLLAAGVQPILSLNVGENYQDQFANNGASFTLDYGTSTDANPLTLGLTSLTAFVDTSNPLSRVPEVQFYIFSYVPGFGRGLTYKPEIADQFDAAAANKSVLLFGAGILRQTKFGSVHITQSANPLLTPKIVLNQLTTRRDIDITVKSTRLIRNIMFHPALRSFKVESLVINACKGFSFNSEEEIMCGARLLPNTLYHQAGSCYMGPENDPNSVVDPQLRVIGTQNLRVVDVSIMPLVTRGNTETPALMIGEKAADLIKLAWGQI